MRCRLAPSNVITCDDIDEVACRYFLIGKPDKAEKGEYNTHKTVKPLALCEYLIALVTQKNHIVLDPFCGSGTTCLAARKISRRFIGIDMNEEYIEICRRRLTEEGRPCP
jgi:site-specific DNA-methyltransferase (adenine-specific)